MYGESVFTTMKMVDGILMDWELHFERLRKGVEFVYGPFTEGENWVSLLRDRIKNEASGLSGTSVVRLTFYLDHTRGLFRKQETSISHLRVHLYQTPLDTIQSDFKFYKLKSCPGFGKPQWWPSFLKAGCYLPAILAEKTHQATGYDDVLFVSQDGRILETSVANVFVLKNNMLFTPPLGPDVLDGVMRRKVLKLASSHFSSIREGHFTMEELFHADAIFCSNSVRGLFLVDRIDDHEITYNEEFLKKFRLFKDEVLL